MKQLDLSSELVPGLKLKNPVMPASGTYDYGGDANAFDPSLLGAIVTKSVSAVPRSGNAPPRIHETPCGLLNAVGIPSEGVKAFRRNTLPALKQYNTVLIVSVAGETPADFARVISSLEEENGIGAYELNFSCPNLGDGMPFGTDPELLYLAVKQIRKATSRPLIVKLSPNVADIKLMGRQAQDAGADILTVANTLTGMAIDVLRRRPVLGNIFGGLSGPAIKPVALRMVWEVAGAVSIPVIGVGGIANATDALEFILAGAKAVQVGTANFTNPMVMLEIIEGIRSYMKENGFISLADIVGLARK
ncbi:Dihydroorotate dehydrogenase, class 1/ 2 [Moorella glycerini]|uniref:Dihydroorotate dehydrogenase n=1 Tax=Neomoorella stamsii TaxID=1266720 RepID=A0A9X7J3B3_9FIRM|nr:MULTISPECIES: dihydroorotate dehydrogenase [Moorella]PRR73457.1 Dihydroorotate dehydrogenase B, catalytic subunit [Moorella stamsii]CEP69226.1 Dihydroorotate dehydrogenase, class 1/ 2 [Moorella glycerini]